MKKTAHKKPKRKASKRTTKKTQEKVSRTHKKFQKKTLKKVKGIIRVPSNIPNFDRLTEGGFEKNSTNMIVGGSGCGKTVFATQFLVGGMMSGEKCLYVTFEGQKDEFYTIAQTFGWNLKEYEKKDLFTFLEYTPSKVKTMLEEGGGAIESLIIKKKISRIVIDSITSFALLFDDELERREAALELFSMLSKWNCTTLLTYEGSPGKEKQSTSIAMEFESDSIILFYYPRYRGKRDRYIEIYKMKGTDHSRKIYHFQILKGKEIKISTIPKSNPPLG